jgi:hypothetical protein
MRFDNMDILCYLFHTKMSLCYILMYAVWCVSREMCYTHTCVYDALFFQILL